MSLKGPGQPGWSDENGFFHPYPPSPMPNTSPSSPIKGEAAPSVTLNLRQEADGYHGIITINQESFEVSLTTDVTISFWVVDGNPQTYIVVRQPISTIPPSGVGYVIPETKWLGESQE